MTGSPRPLSFGLVVKTSLEESPGDRPHVRSDTVTIIGSYTTLLDSTPGVLAPRGHLQGTVAPGSISPTL